MLRIEFFGWCVKTDPLGFLEQPCVGRRILYPGACAREPLCAQPLRAVIDGRRPWQSERDGNLPRKVQTVTFPPPVRTLEARVWAPRPQRARPADFSSCSRKAPVPQASKA